MDKQECVYVPRVRGFLNEQGQRVPRAFESLSRRNVGKGVPVKAWGLHHCQVWSLIQLLVLGINRNVNLDLLLEKVQGDIFAIAAVVFETIKL